MEFPQHVRCSRSTHGPDELPLISIQWVSLDKAVSLFSTVPQSKYDGKCSYFPRLDDWIMNTERKQNDMEFDETR